MYIQLNNDIINIIFSYTFGNCDCCMKLFVFNELINDCIIYIEKTSFIIYNKLCIYCLKRNFLNKYKIICYESYI